MVNRSSREQRRQGRIRSFGDIGHRLFLVHNRPDLLCELGVTNAPQGKRAQRVAPDRVSDAAICRQLEQCRRGGYLDDAAVAERWAEVLVGRRCWGPQKVAAYLHERGIAEDIVAAVQQQVWHRYDETETARRALAKRFAAGPAPKENIIRFLQSRGFSAGVVYALQRDWHESV